MVWAIFGSFFGGFLLFVFLAIIGWILARLPLKGEFTALMRAVYGAFNDLSANRVYPNQADAKPKLVSEFLNASGDVRILTIRGNKYFSEGSGWFIDDPVEEDILRRWLGSRNRGSVKLLVCSPKARHLQRESP